MKIEVARIDPATHLGDSIRFFFGTFRLDVTEEDAAEIYARLGGALHREGTDLALVVNSRRGGKAHHITAARCEVIKSWLSEKPDVSDRQKRLAGPSFDDGENPGWLGEDCGKIVVDKDGHSR